MDASDFIGKTLFAKLASIPFIGFVDRSVVAIQLSVPKVASSVKKVDADVVIREGEIRIDPGSWCSREVMQAVVDSSISVLPGYYRISSSYEINVDGSVCKFRNKDCLIQRTKDGSHEHQSVGG